MRDYKKLDVWQISFTLTLDFYRMVVDVSDHLAEQGRRASTSVCLNIAEGSALRSRKSFLHHLNIAYASAKEVEVVVLLLSELGFLSETENFLSEIDNLKIKLFNFMCSLEKEINKPSRYRSSTFN